MRAVTALCLLLLLPGSLRGEEIRYLWTGEHTGGTRIVSPEMGVALTVPEGVTLSFEWGYSWLVLASTDGALNGTVRLISSCDHAEAEKVAVPGDWTDRDGKPMKPQYARKKDGRLEVPVRSDLDAGFGMWQPGPDGAGTLCYIWGDERHSSRMREVLRELLSSVEHFPASRKADGIYGLRWISWLGGAKLVRYETYSGSGGSGYSNQWRMDLCWDGTFTRSESFSMSMGEVGSAAGHDPTRGVWGVEAHGPNALTLVMVAVGGHESRYDISYDPDTERTYLGGTRYFRVGNEWCEYPAAPPHFPADIARRLGIAVGDAPGADVASDAATEPKDTTVSPRPLDAAPGTDPPGTGTTGTDITGAWVAATDGYAYVFEQGRYTFMVHDGISEWEFADAGSYSLEGDLLNLWSDDDPEWVETHRYSLSGTSLVLDLDGDVTFTRQGPAPQ
jgi:hypothetical protein